ncbi:hypothetical protein Bhyg_02312 [Pseudolycoriella hygida]|uniref:Uncharacterized protein n=1 Tax=Pseudolycoriella hygida TaxID=35572 RepID=A0A9Q0S7M9_9DIPT|nr:hypothetical protein Bhyg_02312 [Pseudolycoriella hygida]
MIPRSHLPTSLQECLNCMTHGF